MIQCETGVKDSKFIHSETGVYEPSSVKQAWVRIPVPLHLTHVPDLTGLGGPIRRNITTLQL